MTRATCSPHPPAGALPLARAPSGTRGFATLPAPPRPRSAALGCLPRGVHAQRRAGLLGLPLALCGFPPSLKSFAIYGGGALWRQGQRPPLRSGWGCAPALTRAPPPWLRGERRDERQHCRGPAAEAAEQPRSASLTPGHRGESPGEPRCALAVTYPGRENQTRQGLFERKTPKGKETHHAAISP